jgi:hypothetical protein
MDGELMHGVVRDENNVSWDCEWVKVPGSARPLTRIMLRKTGETGPFTHYYDAHHPADSFEPRLINRAFTPLELKL